MEKYRILCGADRLDSDDASAWLRGRRLGLLTAASGLDRNGYPTYLKLYEKYDLTVLFAPEHGIHTAKQDGGWGDEGRDPETGLPLYNLPSKGCPEIDEALSLCDTVVYDIQDVGARFYTYIYCLTYLMGECAARGIPVVVLDRPNIISGDLSALEGPRLDESRFSSFIGRYDLPTRYSLTVGELAAYLNEEKSLGCELRVLPLCGWERHMYGDETDLCFVNPSPNIPSVNAAINYIGSCIFEATNISEGRGTTRPFDLVGAPFVDGGALTRHMNSLGLSGVYFSRAFFTPMFNKHKDTLCEGVELHISDRGSYRPLLTSLCLLAALREYKEFEWRESSVCLRYGSDALTRVPAFDPFALAANDLPALTSFAEKTAKYRLY